MKNTLILTLLVLTVFGGLMSAQELKPRDGIMLTIYNIPDEITGEYYIQKDSTLQLPFIGNTYVVGKDYEDLKSEIVHKYAGIYRNPEIMVEPLFRINVLGEVRNPGEYYFSGVESITDIIAKAGGETPDSDLSEVILTRNSQEIEVDVEEILEEGASSSDIQITPGDRIYVSKKWIGGARNTNLILYGVAVIATIVGIFAR
jgi:polysaccharide export outer membrane protein